MQTLSQAKKDALAVMLSAQKDAQRRYTKDKGISCVLRCLREVDFHQNRSFKFPCTCCGRRCALKAKDK